MDQWLTAHTALAEVPGSVPSTISSSQSLLTIAVGSQVPSFGLCRNCIHVATHTHVHVTTYICI